MCIWAYAREQINGSVLCKILLFIGKKTAFFLTQLTKMLRQGLLL